jgi:fatty-acyl-CoA synthase
MSDRETLSYRGLAERSRRYTRWALAQYIAKGDVVALLMPNRPEYFATWLGLTRAGAAVALLNTNLTGASLAYCIDLVAPKRDRRSRARAGARLGRGLPQDILAHLDP